MSRAAELNEPATVSLEGAHSVAELAEREGWTPTEYAATLATHIRNPGAPIRAQVARLSALAQIGAEVAQQADSEAAAALSQHYAVLEALHQRFALEAFKALDAGGKQAPEVADRYMAASIRAQRAAMAVLSALKVLRDSQPAPAPAPAPAPTTTGPVLGSVTESVALSKSDC